MYAAACPQYDDKQAEEWDDKIDMCSDVNIIDGADEEYIY